jgi:HAD superfamily hydrolase (TIGR01509 family)
MTKKLVVFDLGRVLLRICDGWQHACEVVGITGIDWRKLSPVEEARLEKVIHAFDTGDIDLPTFASRAGELRGLSPEQVIKISNGYPRGPFPGAGELLDELHTAGQTTACLSNTNANHWRILTDPADPHGKVLLKLHHRFASHLMRVRKPDPSIYAQVEKELGVPGDRIVFFDDLPENIAAAQARGWTGFVVPVIPNPIPTIRAHLTESGLL